MTTGAEVSVRRDGGVLTIAWARPAKKNALTTAMYARAVEALAEADADPEVRVVVFTGEGETFTSGNDLADFMAGPSFQESSPVLQFLFGLVRFGKPLFAAVNGAAIGVGSTMLLHCDVVYASESARFHLPFVNLGLVPEAASTLLLPRSAGERRAAELLLFGEPFDAATAREAGLVNEVVPPTALADRVRTRAEALAAKPPEAVRETKRLMREPHRAAVEDAIRREARVFTERLTSPEAAGAFAAFFEKKR